MSHVDRTVFQRENLLKLAQTGIYIEYDLFGVECSYYQLNENVDMPSDAQRIDDVMFLIHHGFESRILLSHDIHTKHRLVRGATAGRYSHALSLSLTDDVRQQSRYGGHGYGHLFTNVMPHFKRRGLSDALAHKLTVENPATWLAW